MVWKSRSNFIQESNLRQRVLGNTNPVKLGRCFEFLSNYYGFHRGGDRKSNTKVLCLNDSVLPQNQIELAQSYGITQQTMNNYMRMADMIPELENLIETNIRQRGDVGGSEKKVGLRIKELDRLYGIKNGGSGFYGNQHSKNEELTNNFTAPQKTEKDIADMMGMSRQQFRIIRNLQK